MRLILIRHAESEANAQEIHQGQKVDTSLSKKGIKQAKQVAQRLKDEKIDLIYSSDLKRAKETAVQINKFHKLKIIYDKRLRERDADEDLESFINRLVSFFDEIKNLNRNILVIAHGGTNLSLLAISTGDREKGGKLVRRYRQANTCVSIIEGEGNHFKIRLINCIKHLKPDRKLIKIFEKVQRIPYKVCQFNEQKISEKLKFGDCRHKSALLKKLLDKEGYKTKKMKVIFNWKDLPLPREVLSSLKKSSTIWTHDALAVKIHGDYIFLDPTWNPSLKKLGFPVTENWSGLEDTKQVTEGELEFYKEDNFNARKEEILKKHNIHIDKEEAHKFAEALNKFILGKI
ncbi:MAG: histidine phosphatase family protein [Candidatus Pacearchaeota archaeon]